MVERILLIWLIAAATGVSASAQNRRGAAPPPSDHQEVETQIQHAYSIDPLVHRLHPRPGQRLPFHFTMTTLWQAREVEISPVALMQQESGLILPDLDSEAASHIRILGDTRRKLSPEEPETLSAEIQVPLDSGTFQVYGILVTELPDKAPPRPRPGGRPRQGVNIQMLSRYLLRAELHVGGGRGSDPKLLLLEQGELAAVDGLPHARWYIENPTPTAHKFRVRCRVFYEGGKPLGPYFYLALPIRANVEGAERHEAQVLPSARVRVEAPLPQPIFSGKYLLQAELISDGRIVKKQIAQVEAREGEFPAQDTEVAWLLETLNVSPAQIELSMRPRGDRLVPLKLHNTGSSPVSVSLRPEEFDGSLCNWLVLRPQEFEIPPGGRRNVLVSFRAGDPVGPHKYAAIRIDARPQGIRQVATRKLLAAMVSRAPGAPKLIVENVRLHVNQQQAYFFAPVENRGNIHVAPNARLDVVSPLGNRSSLPSSFSGWVLPGGKGVLKFPVRNVVPGTYKLDARVFLGEGIPPIKLSSQVNVRFADPAGSPSDHVDPSGE